MCVRCIELLTEASGLVHPELDVNANTLDDTLAERLGDGILEAFQRRRETLDNVSGGMPPRT